MIPPESQLRIQGTVWGYQHPKNLTKLVKERKTVMFYEVRTEHINIGVRILVSKVVPRDQGKLTIMFGSKTVNRKFYQKFL